MSVSVEEQNKALFQRWFEEVWNKGNYNVAYEVIDPNFTAHGAGGQQIRQGPDGAIGLIKTWRTAFPDGHMTIEDLIAEGELVTARLTWRGTHKGVFYGVPASGNKVEVTSNATDRIVNNKVVAGWGEVDMLSMMIQIGAIPFQRPSAPQRARRPRQQPQEQGTTTTRSRTSAPADNKTIELRYIQAVNEWNVDALREVVDVENYIEHNPVEGDADFEGTLQSYATMRSAMPDLHFTPDRDLLVSEGNLVSARSIITGTHTGSPWLGVPATGRKLDWTGLDVVHIANGKIVGRWICADILRMLQQLGVVPQMGG